MSTPLRAIREKCLDCCCDMTNEIKLCPITKCSLYPYRFGRGPKREMTDAQRRASMDNLKHMN